MLNSNFKKPNFLCIGVQKGGTTSLIPYLNQHPDIYMHSNEIHFFDQKYDKGIKFYEKHFKTNKKIVGEKTPIYCYNKKCIDRIYKHYPNIKLIIILREPIQRAFSQWNMCQSRADSYPLKNKSFRKTIEDDLLQKNIQYSESDVLQRGFYDEQIKYILSKFDKKNLYIGIAEEIKKNKEIEYSKIYNFLGVNHIKKFNTNLDKHKRKYKIELNHDDKQFIYNIYKPHIENIYTIIGRKIDSWENFYSSLY